ncbi:hypothetical protein CCM_06976 [Cordyceps militaris CM01]|uniref:Uncharacterized protein n=1 Tax=Cordyceps militaris (strain CM01) TaxID=983644 RepID=G3JLI2_CORMM|nr:uncharacterized protein CCM_06976 [Cordyceps militaris CM01]EGX90556.1 hypothetical protein CCM_06976 [Cordyceps militaris CM01]
MLVTLALYHRDTLSRGNSRRIFHYEAYHWGLLFTTGGPNAPPLYAFDATDTSDIDPVTFRLRNPAMDWWLRAEARPPPNPKLLGQLVVGAVPPREEERWEEELKALLEQVLLPVKNTHPQQSCVTWAVAALERLQDRGWVRPFDLDRFKDAALAYADARIGGDVTAPAVQEYCV